MKQRLAQKSIEDLEELTNRDFSHTVGTVCRDIERIKQALRRLEIREAKHMLQGITTKDSRTFDKLIYEVQEFGWGIITQRDVEGKTLSKIPQATYIPHFLKFVPEIIIQIKLHIIDRENARTA